MRARAETVGSLAGPSSGRSDEAVADLISDVGHAELSRDLGELRALEAARARLAQGKFGGCLDCGIGIPFERLSAQPAALRCIECQRLREKMFAHGGEPSL